MIGQLTKAERQYALLILLGLALCGLIIGIAGKDDPLGIHGALIGLAALAGIFKVISVYYDPEPGGERLNRYYDDPTKVGIVLAMIWAVFGMLHRRLGGLAAGQARPHFRCRLVELRTAAPGSHHRRASSASAATR